MKFPLNDGTVAHLHGIVQASAHLRDYLEQQSDAEDELRRIALSLIPPDAWVRAPMVLLHPDPASLADLMRRKKLPRLMCVGQFVSYRTDRQKAMFLYVVWLQEDFMPHIHPDVQRLFADIKWPEPHETTS
jgi:hypothetical protein